MPGTLDFWGDSFWAQFPGAVPPAPVPSPGVLGIEGPVSLTEEFDYTQGDPRISIDENGASIEWVDGQPVMDQGLENTAVIALFTGLNWVGNFYLRGEEKIGSDFESVSTSAPITLSKLADVEEAANRALKSELYEAEIGTRNPRSAEIDVGIILTPPGQDVERLLVSTNGQNWQNQALKGSQ